jgi:hypothetical protein
MENNTGSLWPRTVVVSGALVRAEDDVENASAPSSGSLLPNTKATPASRMLVDFVRADTIVVISRCLLLDDDFV